MTVDQNPNCAKCKYRKKTSGILYCSYFEEEGRLRPVAVGGCQLWKSNRAEKRKPGYPKRHKKKIIDQDAVRLTDLILGKDNTDAQI